MMYTHEIYTESPSAARYMARSLRGSIQSYNIAPDTEMYVVSTVTRYGHAKMVANLSVMNLNFDEVITNKL